MRKSKLIISMLTGIICLFISVSLTSAGTGEPDQPVVVRKKVETPNQNTGMANGRKQSRILHPKRDVARVENKLTSGQIRSTFDDSTSQTEPMYDPTGKIDPFEPLYAETPEVKQRAPEYAVTNQKPLTELEKIDLSQVQLTGVILAKSGNKGFVREASGKGHIIAEGTGIGRHGGILIHLTVSILFKVRSFIIKTIPIT
jgi:Tfp pilus assembly protein PilP